MAAMSSAHRRTYLPFKAESYKIISSSVSGSEDREHIMSENRVKGAARMIGQLPLSEWHPVYHISSVRCSGCRLSVSGSVSLGSVAAVFRARDECLCPDIEFTSGKRIRLEVDEFLCSFESGFNDFIYAVEE